VEKNIFTIEDTLKFLRDFQYPKNIFTLGEYWKYFKEQLKRSVIVYKLEMPEWLQY